jgi:PAS domain S-box-containing protein
MNETHGRTSVGAAVAVATDSDRFQLALEAAPTGMIVVDREGKIVFANSHIERLFQYSSGELIGSAIEKLVPERYRSKHPDYRHSFFGDSRARPMGAGRDLFGLRKDNTEVPVEIGLNPLVTPNGEFFVVSSVVDITERKRLEAALRTQLRERNVLLQEVHHRVKNNLQVISSLINLQMGSIGDGAAVEALQECSNRVQAIGLIHEQLYQAQDFTNVAFSDYARSLVDAVFRTAGVNADTVALSTEIEPVAVAVDRAIPLGLILSELITNSLKHAFPDGARGNLWVRLSAEGDGRLQLVVRDDGIGLPADFDPRRCQSLGMHLIHTLAEQIAAEFVVGNAGGAEFTLRFRNSVD